MSRVVGGQPLLDDVSKEHFSHLLRRTALFCGVEIITYCLMSNHFHVLVRVPERKDPPADQALLKRAIALYGAKGALVEVLRESLACQGSIPDHLRIRLLERMGDVSAFMKELKQRFSRWYNRLHDRYGTLWAERFKSVLIEDEPSVVATVATYIDLNPVRAGLVNDPAEYRFCGYAAAVAGDRDLRRGLASFHPAGRWAEVSAAYRERLFVRAGSAGGRGKAVLSRAEIKQALSAGTRLTTAQLLRLRIRYFSDGLALGSRGFVNEVFALHRDKFGPKRRDGARPLRGVPLPNLAVLRDLRRAAVT